MPHTAADSSLSRVSRTGPLLVAQAMVLFAVIAAYVWCRPALGMGDDLLLYPACVGFLLVAGWCLWSWLRVNGALFEPYGMFVIAVIVFNGGQAVLEVFHLNKAGLLGEAFTPETTLATIYLVTIGLATLHLGALVSMRARPRSRRPDTAPPVSAGANSVWVAGWILFGISFFPSLFVLKAAVQVVLSSGYMGLYQQESATGASAWPRIFADLLVPASLFLLAGSKEIRRDRLISAAVIVSYALIQLFLGGRYVALMPLIAYAWLWHRCIRPLPRALLSAVCIFTLVFVLPVIGETRNMSGAERFSPGVFIEAFSSAQNPLVAAISEMGGTMGEDASTLVLVPDVRAYDHGISYGYAALALVPNLFWSIHPSIAHGTLSNWLIWEVDPGFAARGGGLGFSLIAEAFINFGWMGTPFLLGLVGYAYAAFVRWGTVHEVPERLATVASAACFFTFYARSETVDVLRPIIWYALLPYALVRIIAYVNTRHTPAEFPRHTEARPTGGG